MDSIQIAVPQRSFSAFRSSDASSKEEAEQESRKAHPPPSMRSVIAAAQLSRPAEQDITITTEHVSFRAHIRRRMMSHPNLQSRARRGGGLPPLTNDVDCKILHTPALRSISSSLSNHLHPLRLSNGSPSHFGREVVGIDMAEASGRCSSPQFIRDVRDAPVRARSSSSSGANVISRRGTR